MYPFFRKSLKVPIYRVIQKERADLEKFNKKQLLRDRNTFNTLLKRKRFKVYYFKLTLHKPYNTKQLFCVGILRVDTNYNNLNSYKIWKNNNKKKHLNKIEKKISFILITLDLLVMHFCPVAFVLIKLKKSAHSLWITVFLYNIYIHTHIHTPTSEANNIQAQQSLFLLIFYYIFLICPFLLH